MSSTPNNTTAPKSGASTHPTTLDEQLKATRALLNACKTSALGVTHSIQHIQGEHAAAISENDALKRQLRDTEADNRDLRYQNEDLSFRNHDLKVEVTAVRTHNTLLLRQLDQMRAKLAAQEENAAPGEEKRG